MDFKTGKILNFEPGATELEMRQAFRNEIIGQEEAIDRVVRVIMKASAADGRFRNPTRPAGTFFLLGPTGVGKTYLVKVAAKILFGSPEAFVRVDCSEFQHEHEIARLIGAPPGYIGHDHEPYFNQWKIDKWGFETYAVMSKGYKALLATRANLAQVGGDIQSTEDKVTVLEEEICNEQDALLELDENGQDFKKRNKILEKKIKEKEYLLEQLADLKKENAVISGLYARLAPEYGYRPGAYPSIILLDEIEKAHPALFKLMLQILDEAKLTTHSKTKDKEGNDTFFHNSLIFLTSNLAQAEIAKTIKGNAKIGFSQFDQNEQAALGKSIREMVIERLEDTRFSGLPNEFLGRIGKENIVVFENLTRAQIREGLDRLLIPRLINRFNVAMPIVLNVTETAREHLVDLAYEPSNRVFGMRALESIFAKNIEESLAILACKSEAEGGIIAGDVITIDAANAIGRRDLVFYLAERTPQQSKQGALVSLGKNIPTGRVVRPFHLLKKK